MRKTSQDGGDSTSITSGIESDKKPGAGILKSTKNSIKRKVQSFSIECDDTANEPLLHKTRELSEIEKQSAKLLLSKTKTEYTREKGDDKEKLLGDSKIEKPSISDVTGITNSAPISFGALTATIHNHMNTNVFNNPEKSNGLGIAKTQILVELDTCKPMGFSPSPLIFTTAKIHTDGKIQQMEPVHITSVPILSTIEAGIMKTETKSNDVGSKSCEKSIDVKSNAVQQSKEKADTTVKSPTQQVAPSSKHLEKHDIIVPPSQNSIINASSAATLKQSGLSNIKNTTAQTPNVSKTLNDEIIKTKNPHISAGIVNDLESKLPESVTKTKDLTQTFKEASKIDGSKKLLSTQASTTIDRIKVDINKNIQPQSPTNNEKSKVESPTAASKLTSNIISSKESMEKPNLNGVFTAKTAKESKITDLMKTPAKEQPDNSNKIMNNEKPLKEIPTANYINNTTTSQSPKTLPVTSVSSIIKSSAMDKASVEASHKLSRDETSPVMKTSSRILTTLSNVSNDTTTPKSVKPLSTLTNSTSMIPQIATSPKLSSAISKAKSTSDSIKPTSSNPITNLPKNTTTISKSTTTGKVSSKLASPISHTMMSPAADKVAKSSLTGSAGLKTSMAATQNNAATVVSSISKPITTASSIKHPSAAVAKATSTAKQSSLTSSVKTVSSGIPIVVSDKTSSKTVSSPVNKSISVVSNNSKPVSSTKKSPATKETSTTSSATSSSVKPTTSTSLTKTASKTATKSATENSEATKNN